MTSYLNLCPSKMSHKYDDMLDVLICFLSYYISRWQFITEESLGKLKAQERKAGIWGQRVEQNAERNKGSPDISHGIADSS